MSIEESRVVFELKYTFAGEKKASRKGTYLEGTIACTTDFYIAIGVWSDGRIGTRG